MKALVRVDASLPIGTGHVMRTLTLAEELKKRGSEVHFACREFPGNLIALVESRGFSVARLPTFPGVPAEGPLRHSPWLAVSQATDAEETLRACGTGWDLLVADHYGIDADWQRRMRAGAKKILVIDDVADRHHDCDFLLDQNFYGNAEQRYVNKVPNNCRSLLGPKFALLRREFREARAQQIARRHELKNVLVFYGGADPENQAMVACRALEGLSLTVDVIAGPSNPHYEEIRDFCASRAKFTYHRSVTGMAPFMQKADLSLGGGGSTTWERCSLGLPALVTILAGNQIEMTDEAARIGVQKVAGRFDEVTPASLRQMIVTLKSEALRRMSEAGLALVDGLGASRVVDEVDQ